MVWYARILATEPTDLHSIQACESYLNIINEIFYTLKLICLCYSWFYSQPSMTVIFLFLFNSHGLKFMRKEISFFLRGRMARGAALSKKKFPFWWALAHQKWNFVQIFLRGCAPVLKSVGAVKSILGTFNCNLRPTKTAPTIFLKIDRQAQNYLKNYFFWSLTPPSE